MHRNYFIPVGFLVVCLALVCELPQDPLTMVDKSGVDLVVDSLEADSNDVYIDTVGRTVMFSAYRKLSNLIDSFEVDLDDDTTLVFVTEAEDSDTLSLEYVYSTTGTKAISVVIYFSDGTSRDLDSVIVIDIVNALPRFKSEAPDSSYEVDDGDTLLIPLEVTDTKGDELSVFLADDELPDSATAELIDDTLCAVVVPVNSSGEYSIDVAVTDGIDTVVATVGIAITDKTPPAAPKFSSPSVVKTDLPTWEWESGGGDGIGEFRYVLDNNDFSGDKSTEIDTNAFTSPASLSEGTHTLFVQERDSSGNWSKTGSWAVLIDMTGPDAPVVKGTTPTSDRTPTWSWTGSDAEEPRFRFKLDSAKFTEDDTMETTETEFTPEDNLEEGEHTLYVQEIDEAGNFSETGSFTILIDISGPEAPEVTGTSPTSNLRPVWTWESGGGGNGVFRCALDSNVFEDNTIVPAAQQFIAPEDLDEGEHTLYVQEQDSAGNWSESGSFTTVIDVTPPGAPEFTSDPYSKSLQPEWTWESGGGGSGEFRYRLDNDDLEDVSPNATTSYTSPTNLSEGPHTLFLQEIDSTGNWSVVVSQVIVIDTVPPQPPVISGSALTNSARPVWTWTMGAGGNGQYMVAVDSEDRGEAEATDTTWYRPESGLSDDEHTIYVWERDAAGNWSEADSFLTVIDTTRPGAPEVYGSEVTNNLRPVWSWSSAGGGIGEYRFKLDDDDLTHDATVTSATSYTPEDSLSEDDHTIYVQERDEAGNWSKSGTFTTTVDATAAGAPVVSGESPTNDTIPTWTWTSGGGAEAYRYQLDNQDTVETTETSFTPSSNLDEGMHIFIVQENDGSGNWSASGVLIIEIDLTSPDPPVLTAATPTNDLTPEWSWESGGGSGNYELKIGSDDFSEDAIETSGDSWSPDEELTVGSHELFLRERDAAGNWSSAVSFTVVIDTTQPSAPTVAGPDTTNDPTPLWTWTPGGGGNGTFRYKIDDGDFSDETTELLYTPGSELNEGLYTLFVQERDDAGNWSASGEKTVVVDVTPPDPPTITGPALTNDPTPTWTWSSGGGNGTYRYRLDESDLDGAGTVQTENTSYTLAAVSGDEQHVLYIKERDEAGNWSVTVSFSITIDITKPSAPVIASGTSSSPSGTKTVTWKWQSGGGGNGTFRYRLDGGGGSWSSETEEITYTSGTLPDGSHTLEIQERDDAGNWSNSVDSAVYVLPAPDNVSVAVRTSSKVQTGIDVGWDNNASSYDSICIYRVRYEDCKDLKTCPRFISLKIATLAPGTTTYFDGTVTTCLYYRYRVYVYKGGMVTYSAYSNPIRTYSAIECGGIIIEPPIIIKDPVLLETKTP